MTETSNTPEKKQAAVKESEPAATKPPAKEKKAGAGAAVFVDIFFNIVLLGSIGVIGYLVYEQDKTIDVLFDQQNGISSQRSDVDQRVNALQDTVRNLESDLAAARQEAIDLVQNQTAEIERLQNELVSTRLRINANNPGASQEWLLAEAASLLRLAQQHLVVARDVRTAQALFISADDVLKQIDDPAIFSVREILAGELAALRSVPKVDVQDLYLKLGAIAEQVGSLQVSNDLATQLAEGEQLRIFNGTQAEEAGWFSRFVTSVKTKLNEYFVVRRRDVPIQPLMTPGQEAAVVQVIRLQIEQGRTALLKGEQEIYTRSLRQARNMIDAYLAGDPAVKTNILASFDDLGQRRVVTEIPPLTRTRTALEDILTARQSGTEPAVQQ